MKMSLNFHMTSPNDSSLYYDTMTDPSNELAARIFLSQELRVFSNSALSAPHKTASLKFSNGHFIA